MSFLIGNSLASLAKPFLLLTFACSDPTMQSCDIYQDRFQEESDCWAQAQTLDTLAASYPAEFRDPAHKIVVTYCTNVPEDGANGIFPVSPLLIPE